MVEKTNKISINQLKKIREFNNILIDLKDDKLELEKLILREIISDDLYNVKIYVLDKLISIVENLIREEKEIN